MRAAVADRRMADMRHRAAISGACCAIVGERSAAAWRASAPISIAPSRRAMPSRPAMPLMSTSRRGASSRMLSVAIRLWPPASTRARSCPRAARWRDRATAPSHRRTPPVSHVPPLTSRIAVLVAPSSAGGRSKRRGLTRASIKTVQMMTAGSKPAMTCITPPRSAAPRPVQHEVVVHHVEVSSTISPFGALRRPASS